MDNLQYVMQQSWTLITALLNNLGQAYPYYKIPMGIEMKNGDIIENSRTSVTTFKAITISYQMQYFLNHCLIAKTMHESTWTWNAFTMSHCHIDPASMYIASYQLSRTYNSPNHPSMII